MPPSSSVPRRSSLHRVDRHDNALRRFDDLAGIQAQIFAKARRQDLHAGRRRPVVATGTANAGTPSRGPMSRCSKLGVSAAALSATALREVARKCRLPNPQGELLTLARRYERRADYLLSKYAAYLNMPPMTEAKNHRGDEEQSSNNFFVQGNAAKLTARIEFGGPHSSEPECPGAHRFAPIYQDNHVLHRP
jgi:hypothetical protein